MSGNSEAREYMHRWMADLVGRTVSTRNDLEMAAAHQGTVTPEMVVCLGPGRCMFPTAGEDHRVCPFCLRYPRGRGTNQPADVDAFVKRAVDGN